MSDVLRLLCASILALPLATVASAGEGVPIEVLIENRSAQPLRCLLVFAHWTTLDLPVIAPAGEISFALNRAPDRALFMPRPQDGRPMMLEALHCGEDGRWSETLLKLDWRAPMLSDGRSFRLACGAGDPLSCRWEERL
jgi:hypothetical protein